MQAIQIERFGPVAEVARLVELPDPPPPAAGRVLLRMRAVSINPADLLLIEGRYPPPGPLPLIPGAEGVGEIVAVGPGVEGLAVGDLAMPFSGSCWRTLLASRADLVVKIPAGIDPLQAAMLKANPATALVMLMEMTPLAAGDWVVQNAANSAVGLLLAQLARRRGIRTLGIVRRASAAEAARQAGADAVLVHDGGGPLAEAALAATGGVRPRLAIDAVGGAATDALADVVEDGGLVVNYGLLSGEPCRLSPQALIFRGVRLRGFWLFDWFRRASPAQVVALYRELTELLADGAISIPVAATYPFTRYAEALAHAARAGRDGKVLLLP